VTVPTIDISGPVSTVSAELDAACHRIGFVQIVGHGLDPNLEAQAWETARRFFELPDADKTAVAIPPGDAYGYGAYLAERLAASRGSTTPADLKETFSIGPFVDPATVADVIASDPAAAFAYSPNRWPAGLDAMAAVMERYYDALADLAARLLSAMAVGLGMPADTFASSIDRHTSALRLLHYPHVDPSTVEPGQLRAGAHSDYGTLTLLRQDDAPGGLEVLDTDGVWHTVPATPGAYVVNIGDALERWTAGRWRSTLHRVQLPPALHAGSTERQSIAFFHNANWDAVIDCLEACRPGDGRPVAEPITAGRHLMERFRSTQDPA
jgi:isopenicillin N synthase-like dioxygenase